LLFLIFYLFSLSLALYADDCMDCHGSKEVIAGMSKERFFVNATSFGESVHKKAGIDCVACNTEATQPSKGGISSSSCSLLRCLFRNSHNLYLMDTLWLTGEIPEEVLIGYPWGKIRGIF